jgi:predicted Fe-S protein YdhL (DUF1289 family)
MQFSPCRGGDFCTKEGTHCQGCGRSHEEVAETKALVASVMNYALKMGYENLEEFTTFVAERAAKKARAAQAEQAAGGIGIKLPIGG